MSYIINKKSLLKKQVNITGSYKEWTAVSPGRPGDWFTRKADTAHCTNKL